ncbi:unnamed protein product [Brachionus calyciflorus]|uniref:ISXO2-like transposase domain-containing protein n=1 Tax=Brachionus calyciflorus TaxID=104777 RepID=A0A814AZ78_9BILA|nr:unnamed protein product [Brachionus calyciflorus]
MSRSSINFPKNYSQFYGLVSNKSLVNQFLIENDLINKDKACSNPNCSNKPNMKLTFLKEKIVIRCMNKGCKRYFSPRNRIFNLVSKTHLSYAKILEIFWHWSFKHSVDFTKQQTGLNKGTIIQWFKKIRGILEEKMNASKPLGGPGYSVQIDESLFQGRRKYNRGRLLKSDKKPKDLIDQLSKLNLDESQKKKSKRNYGKRVTGPWVFGLVVQKISYLDSRKKHIESRTKKVKDFIKKIKNKTKRKQFYNDKRKCNTKINRVYSSKSYKYKLGTKKTDSNPFKEVRMFVVEKRDAKTLIPIIQKNVLPGTEIVSDEWSSYKSLNKHGYIHYTVNHSENFVNPKTKHQQKNV